MHLFNAFDPPWLEMWVRGFCSPKLWGQIAKTCLWWLRVIDSRLMILKTNIKRWHLWGFQHPRQHLSFSFIVEVVQPSTLYWAPCVASQPHWILLFPTDSIRDYVCSILRLKFGPRMGVMVIFSTIKSGKEFRSTMFHPTPKSPYSSQNTDNQVWSFMYSWSLCTVLSRLQLRSAFSLCPEPGSYHADHQDVFRLPWLSVSWA